jgi:hypothetical protein
MLKKIGSALLVLGLVHAGRMVELGLGNYKNSGTVLEWYSASGWIILVALLSIGAFCFFLAARNQRAKQEMYCANLAMMFGTRDVESRKHVVTAMVMAVENELVPFDVMISRFRLSDERRNTELQRAIAVEVKELFELRAWRKANASDARRRMMEHFARIDVDAIG